jgi:hypothetical protein
MCGWDMEDQQQTRAGNLIQNTFTAMLDWKPSEHMGDKCSRKCARHTEVFWVVLISVMV